jgi:hypothetical protein
MILSFPSNQSVQFDNQWYRPVLKGFTNIRQPKTVPVTANVAGNTGHNLISSQRRGAGGGARRSRGNSIRPHGDSQNMSVSTKKFCCDRTINVPYHVSAVALNFSGEMGMFTFHSRVCLWA